MHLYLLIFVLSTSLVLVKGWVECCNSCRYVPRTEMYMCDDQTQRSCKAGCYDCRCYQSYNWCVCRDEFFTCPRQCSYG